MVLPQWLPSSLIPASLLRRSRPRRYRLDYSMCSVIRLEARAMPSGNVTATLAGSVLTFEGDDANNAVAVTQAENGDILITGLAGTTINGERSLVFHASDLPPGGLTSVVANGNDGNDSVVIRGLTLDGSLTISGGDGHDSVRILNANLGGLTIHGGSGFNTESVIGTTIEGTPGNLVVTGDGVNIGRFFDVQVGGSTTFDLGDGFNVVTAVRSNFDGVFSLGSEATEIANHVQNTLSEAISAHLESRQDLFDSIQETWGSELANVTAHLDGLFAHFNTGTEFGPGNFDFS